MTSIQSMTSRRRAKMRRGQRVTASAAKTDREKIAAATGRAAYAHRYQQGHRHRGRSASLP